MKSIISLIPCLPAHFTVSMKQDDRPKLGSEAVNDASILYVITQDAFVYLMSTSSSLVKTTVMLCVTQVLLIINT